MIAPATLNPVSIAPRHGVVTLFGYGINVQVDRGHLILRDGIGSVRHEWKLPRVGHGLERLVVIGSDGMVSLAALRWLADQDAAFVMLERDGTVLATTGSVRPSDARLRRAQAKADQSEACIQIVRALISQKLFGQEKVARNKLNDTTVADKIAQCREALPDALTLQAIRSLESQGGLAYWSAWHNLPITFPKKDLPRVPNHWRTFDTRKSPITGSQRLAANPPNAILNYLYAVLESEARLAAAALGLDPGLGFLHVDTDARDSLACDLMEPVRPQVDAYVLDWFSRTPLKREWFFEQRDGTCRLMGSFAVQLSETAPTWRGAVAPFAEFVARTLWSTVPNSARYRAPGSRLTQAHKREGKGFPAIPQPKSPPKPQKICLYCGTSVTPGSNYCPSCAIIFATEQVMKAAKSGRIAAQSANAQALRADTQLRNATAQHSWDPSVQPAWLNEETYRQKIQPALSKTTTSAVASALHVSWAYAAHIRRGKRRPHPRHWLKLAELVGVSSGE
jgi:CRISPR-associated endonuclease Cas1